MDTRLQSSLVALSLIGADGALAVQPQPVDLGPIDFIPTAQVYLGYDDNIEQAPAGEERSSTVTNLRATLRLRAQERRNVYDIAYLPEFFQYWSYGNQNRFNNTLRFQSNTVFNSRSRLRMRASWSRLEDIQDDTNRRFDESGNIRNNYNLTGIYRYGADSAKGQIEFQGGYRWNRYENNLTGGSNNRDREYDSPQARGTFYWRVAPKTRALFEFRYAHFDYLWSESTLNSQNFSYLVGATWRATGKTEGTAKIGYEEKRYDDADKDNTSTTAWDVGVTWRPSIRSVIRLRTQSTIDEGSSFEDSIGSARYVLTWNQDWRNRFSTDTIVSYRTQDYQGGFNNNRTDDTLTLGAGFRYAFRRWFDVGLDYRFKQQDSTSDAAKYDRNRVFLTFDLSL